MYCIYALLLCLAIFTKTVKMLLFCKRGSKALRDTFTSWSSTFFFFSLPFMMSAQREKDIKGKKSSSHFCHFLILYCRWKSWTASCQTSASAWQKHFYSLNSGPSLWPRSRRGTLPQLQTNQGNEMPRATKLTRLKKSNYHHEEKDQKLRKIMEWIILF